MNGITTLVFINMAFGIIMFSNSCTRKYVETDEIFCTHKVILDKDNMLLPWYSPADNAYDHFLHLRWNFIKNHVPNSPGPDPRSRYPQYYFYCGFGNNNVEEYETWMNDVGEKLPNWFENARLYYAYTGDSSVMDLLIKMTDYYIAHGTSPADFAWPKFPYTTTNAGDTIFSGFTTASRFKLHEIQVDHAAEMGLTYYRMYLFSGDEKYLKASIDVADVLAKNARVGTSERSVWPYRVIMDSGKATSEYGANWTGAYLLLKSLIVAGLGDMEKYTEAREKVRDFLLEYPLKTGYWTDGHSDVDIFSNTYKSNLSASNMKLTLFDHPELDPQWKTSIPGLIKWTEDHFVFRTEDQEPATMWGANIVGEQDSFNHKMDYQTARYAAECARWYAISGDETYKEKAFRSLNWVTYCNDSTGMAFESPVSKGIATWWSDTYGECPRMFYHVFAAIPEWAPPRENHILYSPGILKEIEYEDKGVHFSTTGKGETVYIRLNFKPSQITLNGKNLSANPASMPDSYNLKKLGKGDYALVVRLDETGKVSITGI